MEPSNVKMRIDIDINLIETLIKSGNASAHISEDGQKRFVTLLVNPMREPKVISIGKFFSIQTHAITVLGNRNEEGKKAAALFPGSVNTAFVGRGYEENISIPQKQAYKKSIQRPY